MCTLTRLRESMDGFSATEQRVATYILSHCAELADISISTVADECQTSKSMVVRLCKKTGHKGFKDLRNRLAVEAALSHQKEMPAGYGDIRPGDSAERICGITMRDEIHSLQNTMNLLDAAQMDRAVDAILSARRVRLFGAGNSAVVAFDLHNKLQRIGIDSHFSLDTHCQLMAAATLTDADCAIVFSYSGTTKDMVRVAHCARDGGATLVTVTRYGCNPVNEKADILLYVAANESLVQAAAMSSRLAMLSLVNMLFSCVASRCHDGILALLNRTAGIIRDIK